MAGGPVAGRLTRNKNRMLPLTIASDLRAKVPGVTVGWITATVRVGRHDEALWREIEAAAARFRGMTMERARKFPPIKALRDAYRALGNDPRATGDPTKPWCDGSPRARNCTGSTRWWTSTT